MRRHFSPVNAAAKGHFQECALRHFGAFLLPAAVVEVAVAIFLNSLISVKVQQAVSIQLPHLEQR